MAAIVYGALSSINNNLCQEGAGGYAILPLLPILFGFLNPIILGLILLTATLVRYTGDDNWQNSSNGQRSFKRTLGFIALDFYIAMFLIFLVYKLTLCKKTSQYSKLYSAVGSAQSKELSSLASLASKI